MIKWSDLGISVVVSGPFEPVKQCCKGVGLEPHTVEYSLGVLGKTDTLPPKEVTDVATMCGHGMVAYGLIESTIEEIRTGRTTENDASLELSRQCVCGVFNPVRACRLLGIAAARQGSASEAGPAR